MARFAHGTQSQAVKRLRPDPTSMLPTCAGRGSWRPWKEVVGLDTASVKALQFALGALSRTDAWRLR